MKDPTKKPIEYRWLGAAGIELLVNGQSLLVDPYITRLPWHYMFFRHVQPNQPLVKEMLRGSDHILVTHAHIDHLLDVPVIAERNDGSIYGSQNTCGLLRVLGVASPKIHRIEAGDRFILGQCRISVYPARHFPLPGFMSGTVKSNIRPPLTAHQYQMDSCFSFLIEAGSIRILIDSGKRISQDIPAEVLIIHPFYRAEYYQKLLTEVQPKLVIPNHWDNFMAPFSWRDKTASCPQDWISSLVRRLILPRFRKLIQRHAPTVKVLIPQVFYGYDLNTFIA